jgi:hypothetical protein
VWLGQSHFALEKSVPVPIGFFAVGFRWVFLGRSEPNQAEMDAAGTKELVYWAGMGNSP